MRPIAQAANGLRITRDPTDLGPNIDTNLAQTWRFVAGLEGDTTKEIWFEASANWGRYDLRSINRNNVLYDRFLAAIDVTTDARGNPVCRSVLNPATRSPATPFSIAPWRFGDLTFVPGQGQCQPANLFGSNSISQQAIDFITTTTINRFRIEMPEFHGLIAGDTSAFFNMPYDSLHFAVGAEYRKETSRSIFDPLVRGVLPVPQSTGRLASWSRRRLGSTGWVLRRNHWPLRLMGRSSIRAAAMICSTSSANAARRWSRACRSWTSCASKLRRAIRTTALLAACSPMRSTAPGHRCRTCEFAARCRPRAVRAPNITELFAPPQAGFFNPFDPCDQREINRLLAADSPLLQTRISNCRADGIPEGFRNPLRAVSNHSGSYPHDLK